MSGSDAESDSLEGSDEDGFLVDDDGNNMVMIDQMTTNNHMFCLGAYSLHTHKT
jgi:hypothetical protein